MPGEATVWLVSLCMGIATAVLVNDKNVFPEGSSERLPRKIFVTVSVLSFLVFFVMTLVGLWQAWSPWDVGLDVRPR